MNSDIGYTVKPHYCMAGHVAINIVSVTRDHKGVHRWHTKTYRHGKGTVAQWTEKAKKDPLLKNLIPIDNIIRGREVPKSWVTVSKVTQLSITDYIKKQEKKSCHTKTNSKKHKVKGK